MSTPLWIATGIALGTGLGAMMDHVAVGIALGVTVAGGMAAWRERQSRGNDPNDTP